MRGHRDLRRTVTAALLCALLALLLPFTPLSLLFVAPLAFFLPGYAITCAAFAKHPPERTLLALISVGLSLAVLALGALPLDLLPGGIRAGWWALLLVLVVVAACRAAALRRPRPLSRTPAWRPARPGRGEAALLGVGGLSAVVAMVLIFVPLSATNAIGYTELWIEPLTSSEVLIGVGNGEQREAHYTLELRANGRDKPFAVRQLNLERGEQAELTVPVPPAGGDRDVKVGVTLFRQGVIKPYRRVTAWLPGEGSLR